MKVTWYVDVRVPFANLKRILAGNMSVEHRGAWSVVKDLHSGFNLVRVDWDNTDTTDPVTQNGIMQSMRIAAEHRYNEMKENNERTLQNDTVVDLPT